MWRSYSRPTTQSVLSPVWTNASAAAAAAARRVSRANPDWLPRPMQRMKTILPALFALGLNLLWVNKVRLEDFYFLCWCSVQGSSVRVYPLGAICCSRLDENMFTLRAETRAYSCVMHRGEDGQQNTVLGLIMRFRILVCRSLLQNTNECILNEFWSPWLQLRMWQDLQVFGSTLPVPIWWCVIIIIII